MSGLLFLEKERGGGAGCTDVTDCFHIYSAQASRRLHLTNKVLYSPQPANSSQIETSHSAPGYLDIWVRTVRVRRTWPSGESLKRALKMYSSGALTLGLWDTPVKSYGLKLIFYRFPPFLPLIGNYCLAEPQRERPRMPLTFLAGKTTRVCSCSDDVFQPLPSWRTILLV